MICTDSGIARATCYCVECGAIRERADELRLQKAHVQCAEASDERLREKALLDLDVELRELTKALA